MNDPTVFICAGAGGVGKTTSSAALATALARTGASTLLVTVDPARRLAQALGIDVTAEVNSVNLDGLPKDTLFALMPEPSQSTEALVELLFRTAPDAHERFRGNRIYQALQHAMAGIHDLTALMLIASATEDRSYRYIVVDTAPSRFGLDFLSYPGRLAQLFEGRAIGFLGTLASRSRRRESEPPPPAPDTAQDRGLFAWGKKRVEGALAKVLDPKTLYDLTNLFAELAIVRRRFAELARLAENLLLGPSARFLIVASPSGAAEADVRFIIERLRNMGVSGAGGNATASVPHALVLNRADVRLPDWYQTLASRKAASEPMKQTLRDLRSELDARRRAADGMEQRFQRDFEGVALLRLPTVEVRDPAAIVKRLSEQLAGQLRIFDPGLAKPEL